MNPGLKTIPYISITLLWLISMCLLVNQHYGVFPSLPDGNHAVSSNKVSLTPDEQWMGIYQKEVKVGYSVRRLKPSKEGLQVFEDVFMKIKVMSVDKDVRITTSAFLDKAFRLKSFAFKLQSDATMTIDGVVEEKALIVTFDASGVKSKQRLPLKDAPYLSLSLQPEMLRKAFDRGRKIQIPIIEPSTLTQDMMDLEFMGKEPLSVMGIKRDVLRLKGSFKGAEVSLWVAEEGEILKEEFIGFTFIKESKGDAMSIGKPSADFTEEISIPFDMKLPDNVSYLKVSLHGISLEGLELSGGTQRLTRDVLEIKQPEAALSQDAESLPSWTNEYLKEMPFVETKDPAIVSLAKEIVKDEKDLLKKARLIYEWVYKNIQKTPAITMPSASEVLRTRRGDCNEHTALYVALARASGIPSRTSVGLTYKDGYFYYHAWPEVYTAQWVAIDPTLGQFPADAAHIRLLTGGFDKQARLISMIGKLKIKGIEYRAQSQTPFTGWR